MKTPLKKGIGNYAKGKSFTLKSGNSVSGFKMMGASKSPIHNEDEEKGEVNVKTTTTNEGEGKGKQILKKVGGTLVAALTGGLDAVYGSGRIMPGGGGKITFAKNDKKAEKSTKTPGEKIIDGEEGSDKNKNEQV